MRRAIAIAIFGAAMLATHAAGAKDMNGRFGIGAAKTLGGVRGLDLIYWAGRLGLNATVNLYWASPEGGDHSIDIRLALGAIYPVISTERAELGIGGRINIGALTGHGTEITIEAPLRLEWYVTDHLSLHGEVGLALDLVPDEGGSLNGPAPRSSTGDTAFILGATYVTGGGGFTVLF